MTATIPAERHASRFMTTPGTPDILRQDGVTVVAFGAAFDTISEDKIATAGKAMLQAAEADPPLVAIDLSHTKFFSSSFIEVIFRTWNRLKARPGGRLVLCGLTPYCREILEITNLTHLWTVCNDRGEAVRLLNSATAPMPGQKS